MLFKILFMERIYQIILSPMQLVNCEIYMVKTLYYIRKDCSSNNIILYSIWSCSLKYKAVIIMNTAGRVLIPPKYDVSFENMIIMIEIKKL